MKITYEIQGSGRILTAGSVPVLGSTMEFDVEIDDLVSVGFDIYETEKIIRSKFRVDRISYKVKLNKWNDDAFVSHDECTVHLSIIVI